MTLNRLGLAVVTTLTWTAPAVAQREQPGLSIGVVYDQELIWAKGYGYADLERRVPTTPSTIYRIASISKLFTATAIMQLRDAGKLRLDDPVSERLPWFSIKKTYDGGPPITIRHLITHTSGLPRELSGVNWSDLLPGSGGAAAGAPRSRDGVRARDRMEILQPRGLPCWRSRRAGLGRAVAAV